MRTKITEENVPLSWPPPSITNRFILWDILQEIIICFQVILPMGGRLLHEVSMRVHSGLLKLGGKQNTF